jgi:hypothetical protein
MRWAGYVAHVRKRRGVYSFIVGNPEAKRPLGISGYRWVENIMMDHQEVGCGLDRAGSG